MRNKILLTIAISSITNTSAFSQGTWLQMASMPDTGRGYDIGFSIDSFGYAGLGYNLDSTKGYHDLWQYNPRTNSWTQKANFPGKARVLPATFVIGHKAFVVTGTNDPWNDTCYNECWEYDASADLWTRKTNFHGVSRAASVGFAIGGKGYIGTGMDSNYNVHNDFWRYDT